MTVPGNIPSIPLRASGPSRPGTRPASARPTPARGTPQNAFTQALARAQAQNQLFQSTAAATAAAPDGARLPYAQQTGLPLDFQTMAQQPGLPANLQTVAQPPGLPANLQTMTQQRTPAVKPAPTGLQVPGGFGPIVTQAAEKYGVDPALIAAVMETESKFNPDAVSQAGARGLMQLMPATARGLGVTDVSDPLQSVLGGAKLLGVLTQKYSGNLELTLAAYNAGSGAVDKHGGIPPYGETRKYVPLVLAAYERFKAQAGTPSQTAPATPATGR